MESNNQNANNNNYVTPPPQNSQPVNNGGYQPSAAAIAQEAIQADRKRRRKKRWTIFGVLVGIIIVIFVISSIVSPEPEPENPNAIGDYVVTLSDYKIVQDYDGNDVLIVTYDYTNNSSEPTAFDIAFITHAYQNGVEVEKCYMSYSIEDDYDSSLQSANIQPGVTSSVQEAYYVTDMSTPIQLEVGLFLSFEDDQVEFTVNLS